ncbi:universal stress protein [Halobaculum roseum]|uniref:Universal stress protein n=1 Tax=Halobaculum roseum TaxID=2175149 RepID=A0ABD5MK19_9EURY|nr:universal stress protein [Halobaculum roseum]QZY02557.1 universal stress protein [Halobaculum roseum]
MNHVLLAIDENDDRAVAQAETVRDLFDAEDTTAHLLHDFTDNVEGASVGQIGAVRHAATILEDAGIAVEYHETSGTPSRSIIEAADELDVDVISIAGRKRSKAGKALFGSVSQEVVLGTDRPVLFCTRKDGV